MYKFRDTIDHSLIEPDLPAEALNFDGVFLENRIKGYRTLTVSGRELFGNELTIDTIGNRAGGKFRRSRLPIREIVVTYQLLSSDARAFREAFNKLNHLLNKSQVKAFFNDEPDKYFIVSRSDVGTVPAGLDNVTGSFILVCADPYKHSFIEKIFDLNSQIYQVENDPYYDSYSNQLEMFFNIGSKPTNYLYASESKSSNESVVQWFCDRPRDVVTWLEFDISCSYPTTYLEIHQQLPDSNSRKLTSIDLQRPSSQHILMELPPFVAGDYNNIIVKGEEGSEFTITNASVTLNKRDFWYPNIADMGDSGDGTKYPFTDEMYDILRTDSELLKFGDGSDSAIITYASNVLYTFAGVFPIELQGLSDAERVVFLRKYISKYFIKGEMFGTGLAGSTRFDFTDGIDEQRVFVGNDAILDVNGVAVTQLKFDEGIAKIGMLSLEAYGVAPQRAKTLIINNEGTAPTDVDFHIEHTSENGFISLQGSENNGAILVGNVDEPDGINFVRNERLLLDSFETSDDILNRPTNNPWTRNNAVIVRGGKKGVVPIVNYRNNYAGNVLADSNNFDFLKTYGSNDGSSITLTKNQELGSFPEGTRIQTSGGNSADKVYVSPRPEYLVDRQTYSASIAVKNNDPDNAVTINMLGKSVSIEGGAVGRLKFENMEVTATNWYWQLKISTINASTDLDIVVARVMLNIGPNVKEWQPNYQDQYLPITSDEVYHWYQPFQIGRIRFRSDLLVWNKKRSVAWVDNMDESAQVLDAWSGAGMRRVIPTDSNGVAGSKNFNARFYCGVYQHNVGRAGVLEFTIDDGTSDVPLAWAMFWKSPGRKHPIIVFGIRNHVVKRIEDAKFDDFTGEVRIIKNGGRFTFIIKKNERYGPSKTNKVSDQVSYTMNSESEALGKAVNVFLSRNSDEKTARVNFFVHQVEFTKLNIAKYADIPNMFQSGDTLDIVSTENIVQTFLNQGLTLELQDVGSQPILAPVGLSQVYIDYSKFASSTMKVQARIRERWL